MISVSKDCIQHVSFSSGYNVLICLVIAAVMDQRALWFALFLPLSLSFDTEETIMRTIGVQKDVTPLCSNSRVDYISIVCTIKTKGSRAEGCRLQYQHRRGFENKCNSRFRLVKENRVVFLQMINLTAEDSGKSTCECSRSDGTDIIHLLISGEEAHTSPVRQLMSSTVICICTGIVIVAGVVLGFILRQNHCRYPKRKEPHGSIDKVDDDATYTSLHGASDEFYQTVQYQPGADNSREATDTDTAITTVTAQLKQEIDKRKRDQSFDIYQNISF
ncbi:unnamed protein product [Oreochromis niloticus]|nr:unnamed protein product [Mustela putorius furo]